jgi:tetratricopeptide (TPR) repeat protein
MRWVIVLVALSLFAQDDEDALARHAALAASALQSGNYAKAEQENRIVLRLRPGLAEADMNLGLSCFLQKKYVEAIAAFNAGLKLKPEMANANLFLGISRFNMNQVSAAVPPLLQFAAARPDDLQGQYYLGLSYLVLEDYGKAQKYLLSARRIDGRNVDVLYHLAQAYLGEAKQNPARRAELVHPYEDAIAAIAAVDPDSFRLAQLRAGLDEADGKKAEAIAELEKLLAHDPRASGLHYTLGCLYMEGREYRKAHEQFEAEMQLDSPYPRTSLQLGHVYIALEQAQQALPLLRKALATEPQSGGMIWVDMGRAYRLMNQPDKAVAAFEKAISLGQRTSAVYYQLAIEARKAGDAEKSKDALAMSQKLRNEEAPKNLAGMR